jgi:hypothetical protein
MANQITETTIKPPVSVASRYSRSKVIYYGPDNKLTYTTYKRDTYPVNQDDRYMVISKTREYRPDLVAYEQYGITSFWWKILEANGMKDIYDFQAGKNIRLPSSLL